MPLDEEVGLDVEARYQVLVGRPSGESKWTATSPWVSGAVEMQGVGVWVLLSSEVVLAVQAGWSSAECLSLSGVLGTEGRRGDPLGMLVMSLEWK